MVSFRYFFFPVKQNFPIYTLIATVLLSIIQILAKQMCEFFFGGTDRWMNSNVFQVKIIDWKDCFMNKRCFGNKSETLFWERFELFCSHCRLFKKPISAHFHFQFFFLKCHCFQCHLKKNPSSLGVCRRPKFESFFAWIATHLIPPWHFTVLLKILFWSLLLWFNIKSNEIPW